MVIDDFYIDIMAEMEKVNWKSPWAGLEFLGALVKGILEGAADFFTGGLRRQMENYRKQEEYDNKLIKKPYKSRQLLQSCRRKRRHWRDNRLHCRTVIQFWWIY